ncbi:unnamed protein product [Diamesa tonsa]
MEDTPKPIEITHFINPNKFYFKYAHLNNKSTDILQIRLNDYYDNNCQSNRAFFSGLMENSKVAYYSKPNWIRCQVDKIFKINLLDTVVLWSMDYGYPIRITSDNKIKKLTSEFGDIPSPIMCGGLHVLPAQIKLIFENMSPERCRADEWSSRACKLFKEITSQASALLFVESTTHSGTKLGDLIAITSKTSNINMSDKLIQENVAIAEQDDIFMQHFARLSLSSADRWNDDKTSVKCIGISATAQKLGVISGLYKGLLQNHDSIEMNYNMKVLDWKERNQRTLENWEQESIDSETISIPVRASNEIKTDVADLESSMKNHSIKSEVNFNRAYSRSSVVQPPQKPVFLAAGCDIGQYFKDSRSTGKSRAATIKPTIDYPKIHEEWIPKGFTNPEPVMEVRSDVEKDFSSTVDSSVAVAKEIDEDYFKINYKWSPKGFTAQEPVKEVVVSQFDIHQGMNEDIRLVKSTDVARVLVHGRNLKKPVERVSEVGFCVEIEQFLKRNNFRSVYRTQAHCWPHIINGRPVAIVNTEKSGKTYSYLLPIIDMLNDGCSKDNLNTVGPVGVIFVKSSRDVENLHKIIRNIVTNEQVSVVTAFGKLNNEKTVVGLLNTCDLLIATPDCFTRLVKDSNFDLFDKKRIFHVVFDNLDLMLTKSRENIITILKLFCSVKNPGNNPQIIITTNVWINEIEKIMSLSIDPIYVIGNYIESAIFGKSLFTLAKVTDGHQKCKKVFVLLRETVAKYQKTLIVVNDQEEIEVLRGFLSGTEIPFQIYDNAMTPEDIKKQSEIKIDNQTVIICTDAILPSLSINMVQNIIHYSMSSTWTQFSYRFIVSFDYYKKVQGMSELEQADKSKNLPFSMILLDDENNKELPRLIEFFEDHKICSVPDEIKSMVVSILSAGESLKMESGNYITICWNLLNLGRCPKKNGSCSYRHTFSIEDQSTPTFPSSGHIKFEIINVLSAKQYCIKILQHLPPNAKKWKSMKSAIELNEECLSLMETHYQKSKNVQIHHPCLINDVCCVFFDYKWNRGRVLKVDPVNIKKNSTNVKIKLLDTGIIMNVKSTQLMELPSSLQSYPPGVVDLYLKDLVPFDDDETFDYESTAHLKSLLKSKVRENCFVICEIGFVLLDSIFTGIIEIREYLPTTNCDVPLFSIKTHLLNTNRCGIDPNVSKNLQTLAEECGIVTEFITEVEEVGKDENLELSKKSDEEDIATYYPQLDNFLKYLRH